MIQHYLDIVPMVIFAGFSALISIVVCALVDETRTKPLAALGMQALLVLGCGGLYLIGAGLQSPPGYPHIAIPIVFIAMLFATQLFWLLAILVGKDRN